MNSKMAAFYKSPKQEQTQYSGMIEVSDNNLEFKIYNLDEDEIAKNLFQRSGYVDEVYIEDEEGTRYTVLNPIGVKTTFGVNSREYVSHNYFISEGITENFINMESEIKGLIFENELLVELINHEKQNASISDIAFNKNYEPIRTIFLDNKDRVDEYHLNEVNMDRRNTSIVFRIKYKLTLNSPKKMKDTKKLLDKFNCMLHLLTLTENSNTRFLVQNHDNRWHKYIDLRNKDNYRKRLYKEMIKDLNPEEIMKLIFEGICKLLQYEKEFPNALFIFNNYNEHSSVEISILEFYRFLEYNYKKKIMPGLDSPFNKEYKDEDMLKYYINKKTDNISKLFSEFKKLENLGLEIETLRNHYTHDGYYIPKGKLKIKKVKYIKEIDIDYLIKIKKILKVLSYLEIYELLSIQNVNVETLERFL